jgi:hypothetical protein
MSNQAAFRAVGRCQGEEGASCMVNSFFQYASREEPQGTLSTSYVHSTGVEASLFASLSYVSECCIPPPGLFILLFGIRFLGIFVLPQFRNFVLRHIRCVIASILRRSLSISTLLPPYIPPFHPDSINTFQKLQLPHYKAYLKSPIFLNRLQPLQKFTQKSSPRYHHGLRCRSTAFRFHYRRW